MGALLVYGIWRSRDVHGFKVTPEVWSQVERAVKAASKRATDLHDFVENLKPRLQCGTVHPRWMTSGLPQGETLVALGDGTIIGNASPRREFWTETLDGADHQAVLRCLHGQTSYIISLVRDRLERERPLETKGTPRDTGGDADG